MLQNFLIVSAETVDALDHKRVAVFQFAQQPLVAAAVKILAGLLVHKNRPVRQPEFPQGDELSQLILFLGRNSCITVFHVLTSQFIGG